MKRKKRRKNNIRYSKLLIITSLFLFALMIARVTQLALSEEVDDTNLQALARRRTTKTDIIQAKRGNIYSSDNEVLAQNVSSYKLIAYLSPTRTTDEDDPQHVVDKEMTAEKLAEVLEVSKEEILHIANLAQLELKDEEIEKYMENLQEILDFANIVNNAPVDGLDVTIGANEAKNVFRKDEVKLFKDVDSLLQNAPEQTNHMFKIPKVLD